MLRAAAVIGVLLAIAGACTTHPDASPGADGPTRTRLAAAPPPALPPAPASAPASAPAPCPPAMVLVDGQYCTEPHQQCEAWMEPPTNILARCARYAPATCVGDRVHERYCIDRDEYVAPGESLPLGGASWTQARELCEQQGKRLCLETEWELACEGEQMLPYPTGLERDGEACNYDRGNLVDPATGKLRDLREAASQLERCVSPFGVRAMAGNVDEWVWRDRTPGEWRSALKGGWWMPARDRCRPATTAHGESYRELQTGVRCCADAR